ncbi:MAG: hypothetical protein QM739_04060 [Propionivibrio sp.]
MNFQCSPEWLADLCVGVTEAIETVFWSSIGVGVLVGISCALTFLTVLRLDHPTS